MGGGVAGGRKERKSNMECREREERENGQEMVKNN